MIALSTSGSLRSLCNAVRGGTLLLALAAGTVALGAEPTDSRAKFAVSGERFHSEPEVGWKGFLSGLRGFEHFYEPVGQPLYFESPFNTTAVRFLFLHHEFSDRSQLGGGDVNVAAVQARLALTERLGFIATKDGYSWLNAGILPEEDGWNAIAAGLKYAAYVDRENDFVVTPGVRLMLKSGESKVLQHGPMEVSPFVSVAKGWNQFHLIGNATLRVPTDNDDGNTVLHWDLHADYEILPDTLPGFAPLVEIHGLHYMSDGDRLPLSVGGLDYANLGSSDVSGSAVVWAGAGFRWKFTPNLSLGATYEFALTNRNADIMDSRVTADFIVAW